MTLSVRPVDYQPDGSITAIHDETGHTGTIALMAQVFGTKPDGSVDEDWIGLACPEPGCDALSYHPVGGGASRGLVQKMFAISWQRRGQELGIPPAERGWEAIRDRVCAHADAMDGPGSCRITGMTGPNDLPDDQRPPAEAATTPAG
jgi:hypothetical protein